MKHLIEYIREEFTNAANTTGMGGVSYTDMAASAAAEHLPPAGGSSLHNGTDPAIKRHCAHRVPAIICSPGAIHIVETVLTRTIIPFRLYREL